MYIIFRDFCEKCNPYTTEIADLCKNCVTELGDEIISEWQQVKQIVSCHFFPNTTLGKELLPGVDEKIYDDLLKEKLQFNPNYYRIKDLSKVEQTEAEEESKEQYGFDAIKSGESREPSVSQPKLSFPLHEHKIPQDLLTRIDEHPISSGADSNGEPE